MSHQQCSCPRCKAEAEQCPLGWGVFTPDETQFDIVATHVVPGNDMHTHELDDEGSCACRPHVDDEADGLLWFHQAFDGREAYQRGQRLTS
jgi:hypothetical protein